MTSPLHASVLDDRLPRCTLGESPRWDPVTAMLYWVDTKEGILYRYHLADRHGESFALHRPVGFIVFNQDGTLTAGLDDGLYTIDFANRHIEPLAPLRTTIPYQRFNDGACDPHGKLYAGTLEYEDKETRSTGALYRFDRPDFTIIAPDIPVSNGLAWNASGNRMYHCDTKRHTIWCYEYETGQPTHRRPFKQFTDQPSPDGLTMNENDNLYVALYNKGCVQVVSPTGDLVESISVPAKNVTSCTFGGPDYKTLFITTAKDDDHPLSGHIFTCEMTTAGVPQTRFTAKPVK